MTATTRNTVKGLLAVLAVVALAHLLMPSVACGEEARPRPTPLSPEKQKEAWAVEAKCAAGAAGVTAPDVEKVVNAYVSARQDYADKVASLPRTREASRQRRELGEKALAGLKEALTKAVGADKTEKIVALLGPFSTASFRLDRMVTDLVAFELPKEKLEKAVLSVLEYNRDVAKAMSEATDEASREALRGKMEALTETLNNELAKQLNEQQMTSWKERYGRPFFRGPRRQE